MRANMTRSAAVLLMVLLLLGLGLALPGLTLAQEPGEITADPALEEYLPGCSYRVGEDQAAVCALVVIEPALGASDEAFAPGCGGDVVVAQPAACWPAVGPTVDPAMEYAPGCNY